MQALFLAASCGGFSLISNKLLFHKLAWAIATGSTAAMILAAVCLGTRVGLVGSIGATGFAYESVETDSRRSVLQHIQKAARIANQVSVVASSLRPALLVAANDDDVIAIVEERSGGVSVRKGAGPVTQWLRAIAARMRSVFSAFQYGGRKRKYLADQLQGIAKEYGAVLNRGGAFHQARAATH